MEVTPRICASGRPPPLGSSSRTGSASGAGLGTLTQARDGLALKRDGGDGARTEPDDESSSDMSDRERSACRRERGLVEEEKARTVQVAGEWTFEEIENVAGMGRIWQSL